MTKAILLPLLVLAALVLTPNSPSTQPKRLFITHVTIIDVTGAPVQSDMTVVIEGNRISQIGPSTKLRVPDDAQVVDATGKFLIPGLWDMHVHSLKVSPRFTHPLSIAAGVTGVREMWGCPGLPDSFVATS